MTAEVTVLEKIKVELDRIEEDCTHSGKAQFNACDRWQAYKYWLGIPSVMISAVAGAAFFKDHADWGGVLTLLAGTLTAMITFLKPSERAASHKSAGDQYLALRNDARVHRQIKLEQAADNQNALDGLDEFTKRRNEMNLSSPQFATRDFLRARDGVAAGEAKHAADRRN